MKRSGSALSSKGVSLGQALALGVGGMSTVQDSSKVGNSLKTLVLRLQNATPAELEAAGIDAQGMGSPRKDINEFLRSVAGVQNVTANGQGFRNPYAVLGDIAKKWSGYNGMQQSAIAEQLAGKNNANVFYSMMQNWDAVQKSYATAQNAQGSADRELANASDSVTFKMNQVKASFEDLSTNFLTSGMLKTGIGNVNSLLQGVNGIVKTLGGGGSIGAFLAGRDVLKSALTGQGVTSMLVQAALGDKYDQNDQLGNIEGLGEWVKNGVSAIGKSFSKRFDSKKIGKEVAEKAGSSVSESAMKAVAEDGYQQAIEHGLSKEATEGWSRYKTQMAANTGKATLSNGNTIASDASKGAVEEATEEAAKSASEGLKPLTKLTLGITAVVAGMMALSAIFGKIDKSKGLTRKQSTKNMQDAWTSYDAASTNLTETQQKIQDNTDERTTLLNKQNKTLEDQSRLEQLNNDSQTLRLKERAQEAKKQQKQAEAADKTVHAFEKNYGGRNGINPQDITKQVARNQKFNPSGTSGRSDPIYSALNGLTHGYLGTLMDTISGNQHRAMQLTANGELTWANRHGQNSDNEYYNPLVQQVAAYRQAKKDYDDASKELDKNPSSEKAQKEYDKREKSLTKSEKGLNKQLDNNMEYVNSLQKIGYKNLNKQQRQVYDAAQQNIDTIMQEELGGSKSKQYQNWKGSNVLDDFITKNSEDINKSLKSMDIGSTVGDFADNYMNMLAKIGETQQGGKFDVTALTGPLASLSSSLKNAGVDTHAFNNSINEIIKSDQEFADNIASGKTQAVSNNADVSMGAKQYEERYANLQKAAQQAFSQSGMTYDQTTLLQTEGFGKALERSASGITLNYEAYQKLNKEMRESEMGKVTDQIDDAYKAYNQVGDKINEIQTKMANGTATKDEIQNLDTLKASYATLAQNIENLKNQESEITGSNSAVNQFLEALQAPELQDTIDNVGKGLSQAQKDIEAGKTSSNAVRSMEQLFTSEDVSQWSNSKVAQNASNYLQQANKFADVDKNGNYTYSASKTIGMLEQYQQKVRDAGNETYTFFDKAGKKINGTVQDVMNFAQSSGMDQSVAQNIIKALGEYGYDVNISDKQAKGAQQRITDADAEIAAINRRGAREKYMGGGEALTNENLDRVYRAGKQATDNGDQGAYNQSTASLNANIGRLNQARSAATTAHDTEALNAYNDALVSTLTTREKLDSYKNNPIMQLDASRFQGDANSVVSSLQTLQDKQDDLDVANQSVKAGIYANTEAAKGGVNDALSSATEAVNAALNGTDQRLIESLHQAGITGGEDLSQQIQTALTNPDGLKALKIALEVDEKGRQLTGPEEVNANMNGSNTQPSDKGLAGPETTESDENKASAAIWDANERIRLNLEKAGEGLGDAIQSVGNSFADRFGVNRPFPENSNGKTKNKNNKTPKTDNGDENKTGDKGNNKGGNKKNTGIAGPEEVQPKTATSNLKQQPTGIAGLISLIGQGAQKVKERLNEPQSQKSGKETNPQLKEQPTGIAGLISLIGQGINAAKEHTSATKEGTAATKEGTAANKTKTQAESKNQNTNGLPNITGIGSWLSTLFSNPTGWASWNRNAVSNLIDAGAADYGATVNSTLGRGLLGYSYPQTLTSQQLYQAQHPSVLWANQYGQNNPAPTVQSSSDLTSAVKQNTQATKEGTQTTKQTTVQKQVQSVQQQAGKTVSSVANSTNWPTTPQPTYGTLGNLNLPGLNGQQSAKIKVDADVSQAQQKVQSVGKNSNAKFKLDADTTDAESKIKNVGKNAKAKIKVQGDVSDVTKKVASLGSKTIQLKFSGDPTNGKSGGSKQYSSPIASAASKVSSGSSSKQKLTGTVEYTSKFKDKKAPPLTGVAIYISQFPTKKAPPLSGVATYSGKFPKSAPPLSGVVNYTVHISGGLPSLGGGGGKGGGKKGKGKFAGTAHALGTAHANGIKQYELGQNERGALVNELGPQLIVSGDQFYVVGNGYPTFTNLPSDAIIFSADQTRDLLTKGKTDTYAGRGLAMKDGTVSGKAFAKGKKSSSSKSSSDSGDSENDQDWMEVYLKRIEAEISKLDITASSGFKTLKESTEAYAQEIKKSQEELSKYSDISQKYLDKANAVGLSDAYKQKVQNGDISIENIADEGTRKKISSYTQWYEKYLDSLTKEESLKEQILDLEYKASQVRLDYLAEDEKDQEVRMDQLTKYTNFSKNIGEVSPEWVDKFFTDRSDRDQKLLQRDVETQAEMANLEVGSPKWREQERAQQEIKQQREEAPSTDAQTVVSTFDTIITALKNQLPDYSNVKLFDPKTGDMSGILEMQKGMASNSAKLASIYSQEASILQQIYSEMPDDRKNSSVGLAVYNMIQDALKAARNTFQDQQNDIDTHFSGIYNYFQKLIETTSKLSVVIRGTTVVGGQPTNQALNSALQTSHNWRNSKIASLNENIKKGLITIGSDEYNKTVTDILQSHLDDAAQVESTFNDIESYYDTAKQKLELLNDEVAKYNKLTEDSGKSVKQSSLASLYENTGKILSNEIARFQDVQETINTGLRNGTIHVGDATYEALKNQQGDLRKNMEAAANEAQSDIENMFDAIASRLSSTNDIIQQYINNAQDSGHAVGASFYNALIENTQQSIGIDQQRKTALENTLMQDLQNGVFEVGSTDWYNLKKQIDACDKSIAEAQGSIIKYNNALKELKWDAVDKVNDRFDDQIKELSFLSGLIDDSDLWDKDNKMTDSYLGKLGLMASEYDADFKAAQTLDSAIDELQQELAADPSNNTLHEKLDSFLGKKQNYITAAHSLRKEIVELAQTNLSKLQNQLNKLISDYEKLLDAEKDQMDYQRTITKAQESVDTYRKQVMSYTGDTSEEGQAKLQKAQKNLRDAQDDLREKQEDKRIEDIKALLSELEDQFSTAIDNYMKNAEQVFIDQISLVNANQQTVKDQIKQTAIDNGYSVSQATEQLLSPATATQNMVTEFRGDFVDQSAQAIMSVNNIESTIQSYMQQADQAAQAQLDQLKEMQNAYNEQEQQASEQGSQMLQAVLRAAAAAQAAAAAAGANVQDDAITDEQGTLETANGDTKKKNTFYQRYYNKATGQHVLLGNEEQAAHAAANGWQAEDGTGIYSADGQEGAIKVTRLYNKKYGHLYTTNQAEIQALDGKNGWAVDGSIYGVSKDKGTPVYRLYDPNTGLHNFTTNSNERDMDVKAGWKYEGIAYYAPKGAYATGVRRNPQKGAYWTQENGKPEAIIRQSDGAILTPLNQGDSVLNGKATQRLYDMANNPQAYLQGHSTIETDIPRTTVNNDIEVNINLPNVQNADQFVRELQTNPKIEKLIQEMTLGQLNGNNTLKKRGIRI